MASFKKLLNNPTNTPMSFFPMPLNSALCVPPNFHPTLGVLSSSTMNRLPSLYSSQFQYPIMRIGDYMVQLSDPYMLSMYLNAQQKVIPSCNRVKIEDTEEDKRIDKLLDQYRNGQIQHLETTTASTVTTTTTTVTTATTTSSALPDYAAIDRAIAELMKS